MPPGAINGYIMTTDALGNGTWVDQSSIAGPWTYSGVPNFYLYPDDFVNAKVGIKTNTPSCELDVVGSILATNAGSAIQLVDGGEAAGQVLVSDASGNGSWQSVPTTALTVRNTTNTDTELELFTDGAAVRLPFATNTSYTVEIHAVAQNIGTISDSAHYTKVFSAYKEVLNNSIRIEADVNDVYLDVIREATAAWTMLVRPDLVNGTIGVFFQAEAGSVKNIKVAATLTLINQDGAVVGSPDPNQLGYINLREKSMYVAGGLSTFTGHLRWYPPGTIQIEDVRAYVDTAPTGDTVDIDINKNGVTILAADLSIAIGANESALTIPTDTDGASTDYYTVDCTNVGSWLLGVI
jgi:hypothetical protein